MIAINIIDIKIENLKPYEKNPRKNDETVKYVANSIKEFGFRNAIIIDKNNVVICGHTRLKAAKKLKLKTVPCVLADDLTDEQIKAFRLADNKVSEFSEWDLDILNNLVNDISVDMTLFGFSDDLLNENFNLNDLEDVDKVKKEKVTVKLTFKNIEHFKKFDDEIHEFAEKINAEISVGLEQ